MRGVLASWKRARKVIVRRIDQATGEIRSRKVARRYHCRAPPTPRRRPGGRYLALMPRFVRTLIAARRVPFLKIGKFTRSDVDDLNGRLDRCQVEVARGWPSGGRRRVRVDLPVDAPQSIWVTSPGDQILRKLDRCRLGQEASERQWRDIIGLLQAQGPQLEIQDLRRSAGEAGLAELLARALQAAGVQPPGDET